MGRGLWWGGEGQYGVGWGGERCMVGWSGKRYVVGWGGERYAMGRGEAPIREGLTSARACNPVNKPLATVTTKFIPISVTNACRNSSQPPPPVLQLAWPANRVSNTSPCRKCAHEVSKCSKLCSASVVRVQ